MTFTLPSSSLPQSQLCVPSRQQFVEPWGQPQVCGGSADVTVHPLEMGSSWKPGDGHSPPGTGEALLGLVALLLHPEDPALQRQDGSAPG